MFDEVKIQAALAKLEEAVTNNAEVANEVIEEITETAKTSAEGAGQEFLREHRACSVLYDLLKTVSDKFKLDGDDGDDGDGESVKKHKAVFKAGDSVSTVWGSGKVQSFRESDGLYVVLLDDWKLAQGQSPTLYLGADSMKEIKSIDVFVEGDAVNTVWGTGKVQQFRESDNMFIVLLDNWKLAQGQSPTLYLGADSMKKRDFEYERKLAEVKAAHDDALAKTSAILTAIGAIMRRSLPKSNSCTAAIQEFVKLGFIDLVSECLNKFMHHAPTVNAACWCIMVMCSDDPDNQVALAKAGACEGVMQALSTHAGNADIIEYVCRAARNLTSNLSIAHHCVGSGIGELIACVIMLHINRPAQCEAGLWVVTNLSCDPNNATVLGSIGMCDCITSVLRLYLDHAAIAAAASWTVKNLACGSTFNYSQFIHTDVCDSLTAILNNFTTDVDVLSPTLWAIANITCDPALSLKINENEEICNLVVSILKDFVTKTLIGHASGSDAVIDLLDIVEAAMWALRNIASVGATNNSITDSVVGSIHQVLTIDYFLTDESLVDSALATIVNIVANLLNNKEAFKDYLHQLGFPLILKDLLSKHKVESIMCHASKAICLLAAESEDIRQSMLSNGTCSDAVNMMHSYKTNESIVVAGCSILYYVYYSRCPDEVSRLVNEGFVTVGGADEKSSSVVVINAKPFDEIVSAWLPDSVTSVTGWLNKLTA